MMIKKYNNEFQHKLSIYGRKILLLFIVLLLILFAPTVTKLIKIWYNDSEYTHGFLVMPVAIFFVWQKRESLLSAKSNSSWAGLPVLLGSLLVYLFSYITNFNTPLYLSMLTSVFGLSIFLLGWQITRDLFWPLLFLVFMFPIPNAYYIEITSPAKLLITKISSQIISLVGVPVYQEGNILFFANTQLEVTEACSGIRSLYSYLMLGCLFAILTKAAWAKIIIIFSTFPIAFAVNLIRVTVTGILSNYYGPVAARGFFHDFSGVVLFVIGFAVLLIEFYFIDIRLKNVRE